MSIKKRAFKAIIIVEAEDFELTYDVLCRRFGHDPKVEVADSIGEGPYVIMVKM